MTKQPAPAYGSADGMARLCNAMGNPIRFGILTMLNEGVCNVNELVLRLNLEQSKVSKHLAVLLRAELIKYTVDGRRRCYELTSPKLVGRILALFQELNYNSQTPKSP